MNEVKYLYGVTDSSAEIRFKKIGIKDSDVYSVPFKDIAMLVQDCSMAEIKQMRSVDLVINHQYAMDQIIKRIKTIVPFAFCTMIQGPFETEKWLAREYENLKKVLEEMKNKVEFHVQALYKVEKEEKSSEVGDVKAYLDEQSQKKEKLVARGKKDKNYLQKEVLKFAATVKANKTPPLLLGGEQKFADFSCLVSRDNIKNFESALREMNEGQEKFYIHMDGSMAPYSFTTIKIGQERKEA